ncbi:PREDICTED: uncharacterized protein LOC109185068 [Ipomoea nil]|uniref:uncharacterized protein LOC109185068 n=1 Tax=Ipomoea nil TaxID=35883 RepID=UPI0009015B49|nr:PREDICTED: uncharacterized protein LOC109185068 [Ipomoea nil]
MARDAIQENPRAEVKMKLIGKRSNDARTYNLPSVSEVAAIIVGDLDAHLGERDILVETKSGLLKRISELNPAYLPLQYPILFPYGEDGYREDIAFQVVKAVENGARHRISPREYLSYRIHERMSEICTILYARKLFQQFLVDGYTMVESGRLLYIRTHQKALRCGAYQGLSDALTRGEVESSRQGRRVILPSSFTGGARYMIQNYQDAMAICKWIGYPNLFITFTCNPKWPEIERYLDGRNLNATDRPDIICRLFKMKLDALIKEIRSGEVFGKVTAVIYTVEFQKRGLPHAHILLFLSHNDAQTLCQNIDLIISAEIPDRGMDPEYYKIVEEFMIHGPCGHLRHNSPCMVKGRCSKYFPKKFVPVSGFDQDGYPIYRRRDNGQMVDKNGIVLDNRFVVPHNRYLLMKYKAHINVEWCNQSRSIKYLFKYVNKGNDRVTAEFYKSTTGVDSDEVIDEITMFYDCRYISACEATWRLFAYDIQFRTPAVERLSFHMPEQQPIFFNDDDSVDAVLNRHTIGESMFLGWFEANKQYSEARELTYSEMPNKFVWKKNIRQWHPRKRGFAIGRMFYIPPGSGEIYYMRCLLNLVRGPTCFEDIRSVNGVQYMSFRDACYARGLLADDREYIDAIEEASEWSSASSLRRLFITMLMTNALSQPENVWNAVWHHLAEDVQYNRRRLLFDSGLVLTDDEKKNCALIELEKLLKLWNKTLADFPSMPRELDCFVSQLTEEQKYVYDTILGDVESHAGGLYFVYGYGGTGKTFVWKTLSAAIRSQGNIVLNVASSGIASLLMPGGRTAHSRFAIPIEINEDSTCNIAQGDVDSCARFEKFAKWIANIGDGEVGVENDGHADIEIPIDNLLQPQGDPIEAIVKSTFPMFLAGNCDLEYLNGRAILAPTLDVVNEINQYMSSLNLVDGRTYYSSDAICRSDICTDTFAELHTPEFLNGLRCSGIPNHSLALKVGSPVMLLRNIDHSLGLCNGTRLVITRLADHVVEAEILSGKNVGTRVLVTRLSMTPSDRRFPFKFERRQFPLMLSYAMTINKSQGQSLTNVGLFLKKPVFVHGQLYVALSRVSNPNGLKVVILDENGDYDSSTSNVVYKEVFKNLNRVKVRVVNVNDKALFLLWDKECLELIAVGAAELKEKHTQGSHKPPKEIMELVGMCMMFRVAARKGQKDLTSEVHLNDDDSVLDKGSWSDEVECPVAPICSIKVVKGTDSETVKRCLLNEFSSSKGAKNRKESTIKVEKRDK